MLLFANRQEAEVDLSSKLDWQVLRVQGAAEARRRQECAREVPAHHQLPGQGRTAGECAQPCDLAPPPPSPPLVWYLVSPQRFKIAIVHPFRLFLHTLKSHTHI